MLYRADRRIEKIVNTFTVLALFIACLGLFGLVSFVASQRTKEIGIRKVLGATIPGIFVLLSKEFIKWVLMANIIAWPIAYYFMNKWLGEFAYRIDLSIWLFVFSGGLALVIALATVSYQAIKAAIANPVEALRYE
jgi:putative ABC transport system permease protein